MSNKKDMFEKILYENLKVLEKMHLAGDKDTKLISLTVDLAACGIESYQAMRRYNIGAVVMYVCAGLNGGCFIWHLIKLLNGG